MKTRFITLFVFFTMTFQSIFAQVWEKQIPPFAPPTQIWEAYTPNDTVGWAWGFAFDGNGDYTYEDYELLRTTDGGQTPSRAQGRIFKPEDDQLKKQQIHINRFVVKDRARTRSTYPDQFFDTGYVGVGDALPLARIQ